MIDREKLANFDLGRLTLVGWLLLLISVVGGIALAISVGFALKAEFPVPNGKTPKWILGVGGALGFGGIIGLFRSSQWLFEKAGIQVVRPENDSDNPEPNVVDRGETIPALMTNNSGALELLRQEQVEIKGFPLNRPMQVVIGLILVSLGYFLFLVIQLQEQDPNRLEKQGSVLFLGLLGVVSIIPWGRPYTIRFVFGLFSLAMVGIAGYFLFSPLPAMHKAYVPILLALPSGSYALFGRVAYLSVGLMHLGVITTQVRLKLTNLSDHLILILTEPDGQDYWIRPGESVELMDNTKPMLADFVLEENEWGVTVNNPGSPASISVYSKDRLLAAGYQRPDGCLENN